ncbi:MAG: SRPBCC domain-containing protein [Alphaproteobacteria bacterium]|nr:MAG: SRPBCC domain-containing protein [Alphaproteobacteria bacterium]
MRNDKILRLERIFAATPQQLFDAWTKADQLVRWWGPEGCTTPHCDLDIRQGGAWITTMRHNDGSENTVSGVYRLIEPPRRLVFTWAWHNDGRRGHESEVALDFEPVDGGTRMVLVQKTFQSDEQCDKHRMGWTSSFNDLARHIEGQADEAAA